MTDPSPRAVAEFFQQFRDELGFINEAQVREKDTYHRTRDGDVVGAVICNHCVRKPQTTIYDIAVAPSSRREGVASALVTDVYEDSPHDRLVAKCPQSLAATAFYEATGWELTATESGKHRPLNVYEYNG